MGKGETYPDFLSFSSFPSLQRRWSHFLKKLLNWKYYSKTKDRLKLYLIYFWLHNLGNWGHFGGNVYLTWQGPNSRWFLQDRFIGISQWRQYYHRTQSEHSSGFFPDPRLLTLLTSFFTFCSLVPNINCSFWCLVTLVTSQAASCLGILNSNWKMNLIPAGCFLELTLSTPGTHPASSVLCQNITMQMVPNTVLFFRALATNWQRWTAQVRVCFGGLCSPHCVCKDTVTRQELYPCLLPVFLTSSCFMFSYWLKGSVIYCYIANHTEM